MVMPHTIAEAGTDVDVADPDHVTRQESIVLADVGDSSKSGGQASISADSSSVDSRPTTPDIGESRVSLASAAASPDAAHTPAATTVAAAPASPLSSIAEVCDASPPPQQQQSRARRPLMHAMEQLA